MCGIAALFKSSNDPCAASVLRQMTDVVAHRGPDDFGLEIFGAHGDRLNIADQHRDCWTVGLGHRRLSILDLTSGGHQPMHYRNRFWLTYNGEIYNYLELRQELSALGHSFQSTSDSEVILAAFAEWGPACFIRFRGMWGLVILDTVTRRAILSRDRLGIKPLYVWRRNGLVVIGSEIKQFLCIPGFRRTMNLETCGLYLLTGYEEPLGSLFAEVSQMAPGCWQTVDIESLRMESPQSYWNPERLQPTIKNQKEASEIFAESLTTSVELHLRSDVPVGCALSGGLDSSSVALLADKLIGKTGGTLNTYSAVFPNYARDERVFIDEVLKNVNAQPFFVTPSPRMFLEDLNRLIWIHDEPPGSFAMHAAYCISRLARQTKVPVMLNGQGGDEVLGGYWQLYFTHLANLLRQGRLVSLSWNILGCCLPGGNPGLVGQIPVMCKRYQARRYSLVPLKLRGVSADSILGASKLRHYLQLDSQRQRISQIREMFLPQLLKWDDRNFMAFSVEGRYPFLDHELIELCLQFHPDLLYSRGWTKCPLRRGLDQVLPWKIRKRRSKWGFETPQDEWLCGPLRPEIERWLEADRPVWSCVEREDGERLARQVWASAGRAREIGQMLFRLFVFDRWLERFSVCGLAACLT